MDPSISSYLFNLCVGFQARPGTNPTLGKSKKGTQEDKKGAQEDKKEDLDVSKQPLRKNSRMGTITPGGSRFGGGTQTSGNIQFQNGTSPINPLEPSEAQLDLDFWHCATATFEAGKISCQYFYTSHI